MRYVITGGFGYLGSRLVDLLSRREDTERIVICDVAAPRDGGRRPGRDSTGARHLIGSGIRRLPRQPRAADRGRPGAGRCTFSYARDKTESDRVCQLWAASHAERTMTIVRPCIVFAPNADNYLVRLWTTQRIAIDIGNLDNQIQFVHEDDVVDALAGLLLGRHGGAFDLAPDDAMTIRECCELIGTPIRRLPLRAYRGLANAAWVMRASEVPPGQIDFALYPWVVSNEKLKRPLDWTLRHTSREAFEITMRAHGKLPPAEPAPVAQEAARTTFGS